MRCVSAALAAVVLSASAAIAAPSAVMIHDDVTGAPVAGAVVVFAREGRPGPYPVTASDPEGRFELQGDATEVLVLHPSYLPRAFRVANLVSPIVLEAGESVNPAGGATLRVYLASWIGRYDVEELPALASNVQLRCGGKDVIFGASSIGHVRTINRAVPPELGASRDVAPLTVHAHGPGVVYLAPDLPRSDAKLARSRILDDRGNATFQDAALGDRAVVVAAADGYAPAVRRLRVGNPLLVEIQPAASLAATATLRCDRPTGGVAVQSTFKPKEIPWLAIRRTTTLDRDGTIHVRDAGSGLITIVASEAGHRDSVRDILLAPDRSPADAGSLCPAMPFVLRGSVAGEGDRPARGAVV